MAMAGKLCHDRLLVTRRQWKCLPRRHRHHQRPSPGSILLAASYHRPHTVRTLGNQQTVCRHSRLVSMLWIRPARCKHCRSTRGLRCLVWQRVLHDRFALRLRRLSCSQLCVILRRAPIPNSMKVTSEFNRAPRVHLPVQWRTFALQPPPPHILLVCKFRTVEHIAALQPLQRTKPVDLTHGEVHKCSPPFVHLPCSLYSGRCKVYGGKGP
mmetsp:Transcript_69128/g.136727  ORF Transcript_69128/g.136727 Transcript_69128/m.136727 type:complete len:211 (-) Transcript_69128:860-1492(-)